MEKKLKVEYAKVDELKPYENNAKIHTPEQIEQIKQSILEFGMNDPIAVWKDNEIIEGHGRLIACKELGGAFSTVPIIRLDELTDEQRRAYMLVHNKLTMNTGFDIELLDLELQNLELDMNQFGFSSFDFSYLDEIEGYEEGGSSDESEVFSMTFTFKKEHEEALLAYTRDNGKEEICRMILDFVEGGEDA